jgi:hypothetical protein
MWHRVVSTFFNSLLLFIDCAFLALGTHKHGLGLAVDKCVVLSDIRLLVVRVDFIFSYVLILEGLMGSSCTANVDFKKRTAFYPHSVFVRFVWISGQRGIMSLYSIN